MYYMAAPQLYTSCMHLYFSTLSFILTFVSDQIGILSVISNEFLWLRGMDSQTGTHGGGLHVSPF